MRVAVLVLAALAIAAGCSSSASNGPTPGGDAGGTPNPGLDGSVPASDAPPPVPADATTTSSDASSLPPAGNPSGSCTTLAVPAAGKLVDTSSPTTVVGSGTPDSCTFDALNVAVTKGGIVTFDCGPNAVTVPVKATLTPPTSNAYAKQPPVSTVIDGGNKVTLDGLGAVRILSWVHQGSWRLNTDTLTLQRIRLVNGNATPTQAIPACPPAGGISNTECSTGYDDGQGGALHAGR